MPRILNSLFCVVTPDFVRTPASAKRGGLAPAPVCCLLYAVSFRELPLHHQLLGLPVIAGGELEEVDPVRKPAPVRVAAVPRDNAHA